MVDEKVGDSQQPPESQPEGEPQVTPPANPYSGKTAEELLAILQEKDKMIGKQSQEVGDLRNKASELETKLTLQNQFGFQQREPNPLETPFGKVVEEPEKQEEVPADFYSNPREYFEKWQTERERQRVEAWQKRDMEIRFNLYRAKPVIEQAKKESPHLFTGLTDQELETTLYNGLANNLLSPYSLADTRTYKQAALWIQGEKSGYQFNPNAPKASPVPPTTTESYAGYQSHSEAADEEPIVLDDLGKELVAHRPKGVSEKDFLAKVREEMKRR